MSLRKIIPALLLLPLLAVSFAAFGQQSSKSKSKSKLYEKDAENRSVRITNCRPLNSPATDYCPSYYRNGLVYVSARAKNGPKDQATGERFFDLYFSPLDPTGELLPPQRFSLQLNSAGHEGPLTFSRDWQTVFFTRSNLVHGAAKHGRDGMVHLKIYEASRGRVDWEKIRELPFDNDDYSCMHPALSLDGQRLFFASDMPGGQGGYDLYVCERTGETWSEPRNLGPAINTAGNEVSPFIHPSGTLFFASNQHNTLGGLDIYFSEKNDAGNYAEPVNMGEPFNSPKDDLGLILEPDNTHGFFSSSREPGGYGKDDIYQFNIEEGVHGIPKPTTEQVRLHIVGSRRGEAVQGAEIRIFTPSEEGFISVGQKDVYSVDLAPTDGSKNSFELRIVRKNASEIGPPDLFSNAAGEAFHEFMQLRTYLVLVTAPGYRAADKLITLNPAETPSGDVTIPLEDEVPCTKVYGQVNTDFLNTRISNATLLFTHKMSNRQATARTNSSGEFGICLPDEGEYLVAVEKPGCLRLLKSFTVKKGGENFHEFQLELASADSASTLIAGDLVIGSKIIINHINYEPSRANHNESARQYFYAFSKIMKDYPEMEVDLLSYTDSRGDDRQNLLVTQERADNARELLGYFGIDKTRIRAMGKGETDPVKICPTEADCTEKEREANVRTVIVVRKLGTRYEPKRP